MTVKLLSTFGQVGETVRGAASVAVQRTRVNGTTRVESRAERRAREGTRVRLHARNKHVLVEG